MEMGDHRLDEICLIDFSYRVAALQLIPQDPRDGSQA